MTAEKCTKAWCTCRVVVLPILTYWFWPFSLTSPSSLLAGATKLSEPLSQLAFEKTPFFGGGRAEVIFGSQLNNSFWQIHDSGPDNTIPIPTVTKTRMAKIRKRKTQVNICLQFPKQGNKVNSYSCLYALNQKVAMFLSTSVTLCVSLFSCLLENSNGLKTILSKSKEFQHFRQ